MRVVNSGRNEAHEPPHEVDRGTIAHAFERPERASALLAGISCLPGIAIEEAPLIDPRLLLAIHDAEYLTFLEQTCAGLEDQVLFPSVFATSTARRRTTLHQIGEFCFDTYTPLLAGTFQAAFRTASACVQAAQLVTCGEKYSYALGRPPGHHAERSRFGGYSYLNGTALAANELAKLGPVAVLDVDIHHGNGTQQIFYDRADIRTASIHGDPGRLFPYFSGYADEQGSGSGNGNNRNFPLDLGVGDREYQLVLESALEWLAKFRAAFLVVALGFDAHEADPIGGFKLTTQYFTKLTQTICQLGLPTVFVQEGGYSLEHLGECAAAFVRGIPRDGE